MEEQRDWKIWFEKLVRVGDLCCNVIFVIPGKKFGILGERGGSVKLKSILKWLKVSLAFSKARSFFTRTIIFPGKIPSLNNIFFKRTFFFRCLLLLGKRFDNVNLIRTFYWNKFSPLRKVNNNGKFLIFEYKSIIINL